MALWSALPSGEQVLTRAYSYVDGADPKSRGGNGLVWRGLRSRVWMDCLQRDRLSSLLAPLHSRLRRNGRGAPRLPV